MVALLQASCLPLCSAFLESSQALIEASLFWSTVCAALDGMLDYSCRRYASETAISTKQFADIRGLST